MNIQLEGKIYTTFARWVDQDEIQHIEFIPLDDFMRWNEMHTITKEEDNAQE